MIESPFQQPTGIQVPNTLWENPDWVVEEAFSGYRCLISINKTAIVYLYNQNIRDLKDITNYFPQLRGFKFEDANLLIDAVLVAPPGLKRTYLSAVFANGPLGAEKMQLASGRIGFVLVDLLSQNDVDLRPYAWHERQVYLEEVFNEVRGRFNYLSIPLCLSEPRRLNKKDFYTEICIRGGRGALIKNKTAPYTPGISGAFFKVFNTKASEENVTLRGDWGQVEAKEVEFDFDQFLALRSIENLDLKAIAEVL